MSRHLVLVLPGGGYGALGPAIRIPSLAVQQCGAEVRDVVYPAPLPDSLDRHACREFDASVRDQIQQAIDGRDWKEVTFIAKSRGTMVLGSIGGDLGLSGQARAIWLTPMFGLDHVCDGAARLGWPSLVVSGSTDPSYDSAAQASVVSSLGATSLLIDGADHSLEVPNDVLATLDGMQQLSRAVLTFVGG